MELSEVYYIPTFPGLYRLLDGHKRGLLVESIMDGKREFISDRCTISNLGLAGVYLKTTGWSMRAEEGQLMPLAEVFQKMKDSTLPRPSGRGSKKELIHYMKNLIPNLDEKRIHTSFIIKVIWWFTLLDGKLDCCTVPATDDSISHNS